MAGNDKDASVNAISGALTSERLRDMVLDHVLDHGDVYLSEDVKSATRFVKMLDAMTKLANEIALQALANRQNLSPLPTFSGTISNDPDQDLSDPSRYELRYRLVEQIGDAKPHRDVVMTLEEARAEYSESFVENYWGVLGDKCPGKLTTPGDRNLWFSVVRYPLDPQLNASIDPDKASSRSRPGQ